MKIMFFEFLYPVNLEAFTRLDLRGVYWRFHRKRIERAYKFELVKAVKLETFLKER